MNNFILIVAFFATSRALELNCNNFIMREMNQLPMTYSCYLPELLRIEENQTVTAVFGIHIEGKSNLDVGMLYIRNYTSLEYFPRGIDKFFPNLIALAIDYCDINFLNGDEISAFPNLFWFVLNFNPNLIRIPGNFFSNNPNMATIWFAGNSIKQVGENLLSSLTNLNWASFLNNYCINRIAFTSAQIPSIIETLASNCTDIQLTTTTTTTVPPSNCGNLNEVVCKLQEQNQILLDDNSRMKSQIEEINTKLNILSQENQEMNEKLDAILAGIVELASRPCGV